MPYITHVHVRARVFAAVAGTVPWPAHAQRAAAPAAHAHACSAWLYTNKAIYAHAHVYTHMDMHMLVHLACNCNSLNYFVIYHTCRDHEYPNELNTGRHPCPLNMASSIAVFLRLSSADSTLPPPALAAPKAAPAAAVTGPRSASLAASDSTRESPAGSKSREMSSSCHTMWLTPLIRFC